VIEDDADLRTGILDLLREEGLSAQAARDGAEALAYLKQAGSRFPSLILLDLSMPGMNGWDFRRRQLADPSLASIPVVVMTSYSEYGSSVASLRADGHLQKPVRVGELQGVVERFR
jgi:CheY-like chemotaxis protein